MQLGQAEAVRVLHHHQVGVRHVHADLDHGRGDQNIVFPRGKGAHDLLLVRVFHAPVQHGDAPVRQRLLQVLRVLFGAFELEFALLDQRADHIHLPARLDLLVDEGGDAPPHILPHGIGLDRLAAGRQLVQHGHVKVAVQDERERARDGGGGHDEHMRRFALGRERGALRHAEAVLLVRHDRAQPVEGDALLDERVRADHDLRRAGLDRGERRALLRRGHRAGEQGAGDAQLFQQGGEGLRVLGGEDLGRRHEGGLPAVLRRERA